MSLVDGVDKAVEIANMKCLGYGHTFVRENYDACPEVLSSDTIEITDGKDNRCLVRSVEVDLLKLPYDFRQFLWRQSSISSHYVVVILNG